jgi:uncharacterized lipoprotein NlpE involved in copper resistance
MKTIILFLVTSLVLVSCSNSATMEGRVVTNVKILDDKTSIYTSHGSFESPFDEDPRFYAHKGLYNVGDTIKFTK